MVWVTCHKLFGPEFPIVVADPETGERIETIVDLPTIKPKELKLVSDENGHFEYTPSNYQEESKAFWYSQEKKKSNYLLLQR